MTRVLLVGYDLETGDFSEKGPVVVVMQRLHESDFAGYLIEHRGWHHLDLPAIAVEMHGA